METTQSMVSTWQYGVYFLLVLIDPAVMGYVLLIPFLVGLFFASKRRLSILSTLLFFEVISTCIVLSAVVISIPSALPSYNPRDLLPLTPLFTTLSAMGLLSVGTKLHETRARNTVKALFFVAYFGMLNYIHSVYVWFVDSYKATALGSLMSNVAKGVGLSLMETSFQLSPGDRAVFVVENLPRMILLSLVSGIPFAIVFLYEHYRSTVAYTNGLTRFWRGLEKLTQRSTSHVSNSLPQLKRVMAISLILSVIVFPRAEMLIVQGGPTEVKANQLKAYYGEVHSLFDGSRKLEGNILTFKAPMGLPYYLPGRRIIDLQYPANLAHLRLTIEYLDSESTVTNLKEQGIRYLLFTPDYLDDLDQALHSSFSRITMNPALVAQMDHFGSWTLYALGPYDVLVQETLMLDKDNWDIYCAPERASFYHEFSHELVHLQVTPENGDNRLDAVETGLPMLNVSDFQYLRVNVTGSDNALFTLRLYFSDGTSWDFPYRARIPAFGLLSFSLKDFKTKALSGVLYAFLESIDDLPAYVTILSIDLMRIAS
jgi:hypothetical protein